jgi:ethanolamine utilization protein EutN
MQVGTVIGTATSTVKHPSLAGWKMLVVQFHATDGRTPDGEPVIAVDVLGAGTGDTVILTSDGKETRTLLGSETTPVRYNVMGILD